MRKGILCTTQEQYDKIIYYFKNRGYKIHTIEKLGPFGVVVFIESEFIGTDSLYSEVYFRAIKDYYDIINPFFVNEIEI